MTDLSIAADPFATDFERAYPHDQVTAHGEEWTSLRDRGPVKPDDPETEEYRAALLMNTQWDALMRRHWKKVLMQWNGFSWETLPFTDAMKATERARFQGK